MDKPLSAPVIPDIVAWRKPPEPACPGPTSNWIWSFSMDSHVQPERVDPDAELTDGDIAFERLATRVQERWESVRQGIARLAVWRETAR